MGLMITLAFFTIAFGVLIFGAIATVPVLWLMNLYVKKRFGETLF